VANKVRSRLSASGKAFLQVSIEIVETIKEIGAAHKGG